MNRTTKILLGTFVALLVAAAGAALWPKKGAGPDLLVAGWGPGTKLDKAEEEGPIDRIELAIGKDKVVLARAGRDWTMTPPDGARADKYRVRQILEAFREDVSSVVSSRAKPEALKSFGLDDEARVSVTLSAGGAVRTAIEVGALQKPDAGPAGPAAGGEGDTFVRVPGSDRVYRVIGKDVRRPFEGGIQAIRDKKLFGWEGADVAGITIRHPAATEVVDREVVLASDEKPAAAADEGEGGAAKKPERVWRFETLAGLAAGDVRSFANNLAALYAQEFADKLPDGVAIGPDAYRVSVQLADGKEVEIAVSEVANDAAWLHVTETPGYAKVAKHTAEQIRKKVGDLRDKTIFGVKREDIRGVRIVDGDKRVAFERDGNGFKAIEPAGLAIGRTAVDTLLGDLETLKADTIVAASALAGTDPGLAAPAVTVTVRTKEGVEKTLSVGREKDKGVFYARLSGNDEVVTIAQWMLGKVRKSPSDLRNRKVFDFEASAIDAVELVHKDETTRIERKTDKPEEWRGTSPKVEETLKAETVKTLLSSLGGLTVKDFAADRKPGSAKPDLTVTVTLKDKSRHVLQIGPEKKDNDPYATAPGEKGFSGTVFVLNQYQVKNFQKRLAELK